MRKHHQVGDSVLMCQLLEVHLRFFTALVATSLDAVPPLSVLQLGLSICLPLLVVRHIHVSNTAMVDSFSAVRGCPGMQIASCRLQQPIWIL